MDDSSKEYIEHLKTNDAQKVFQQEHTAYKSKFQLRVYGGENPYVDFGNGVKLTFYRKFHNVGEILKFLNIGEEVREEISKRSKLEYSNDRSKAYFVEQKKLRNKVIYDQFGVSQPKFLKLVNGKIFEAFVKPIPKEIKDKLCFNAGGLSQVKINRVRRNLELLIQAVKDGQNNILPIIMLYGKNPAELREKLGKGLWKRICANSFSRNAQIVEYLTTMREDLFNISESNKTLESIMTIPTTLLKNSFAPSTLKFLEGSMKGKWGKGSAIRQAAQEFSDTVRLIETIDGKAPPEMLNWSLRRLKEEHRAYTEKAIVRRYNTTKFWWVDEFPISHFGYEGYEVKLLKSEAEIGLEGSMMAHCVGGYGSYSSQGRYLVFSVLKDGERHSTIGIDCKIERAERVSVPKLPPLGYFDHECTKIEYKVLQTLNISDVYFNQQYKKYNEVVSGDDKAHEIPGIIIKAIKDYMS